MSILDFLTGGAGGGSLMQNMKQNGQNMSIMQMLGLDPSGQQYTAPIGPQQGTGTPMPSSEIDPKLQSQNRSSALAKLGQGLSTWGAGVSAASGPSRMPVDFGQTLAGGTNAMNAEENRGMENRLKEAQIGALGAKQQPDLEKQAQSIMLKKQMGVPLTPQEEALAGTYDAFGTAKMQTITMPDGSIRQVPAQRPVFGQMSGGRAAPQGGGQSTRPTRPPLDSFMR